MVTEEALNARCAFHQNQPATFTCERCGNRGCELCRALSKGPRCAACFALGKEEAPPLVAVAVAQSDFHEVLRESLRRPWAHKLPVLAVALWVAMPEALSQLITRPVVQALGPALQTDTASTAPPTLIEIQQEFAALSQAIEPYVPQLMLLFAWSLLASVVAAPLLIPFLTSRPRLPGAALRFLPAVGVGLVGWVMVRVAAMACCLPAIPVLAGTSIAVASVVVGGHGALDAIRAAVRLLVTQFWMIVGLEVMLLSLVLASMMMIGAVQPLLDAAFGNAGGAFAVLATTYLSTVVGTTQIALGVVLFERSEPAPSK